MARTNQGGSILGFVVIGGILTLLLLGGVYFVRQKTMEPAADTTTAPAPASDEKPEEEKKPSPEKASPETKPEEQKPAQNGASSPDKSSEQSATELPQTGPKETVFSAAILGLLAAVVLSYFRSRRAAASL